MQYAASLTILANTLQEARVNTSIQVHEPFLIGYEVFFPPGCAGLCYIALAIDGRQFAPSEGSADRFFHGEGSKLWTGKYRLGTGLTDVLVTILGYNLDDTYPHTPIISLNTDLV